VSGDPPDPGRAVVRAESDAVVHNNRTRSVSQGAGRAETWGKLKRVKLAKQVTTTTAPQKYLCRQRAPVRLNVVLGAAHLWLTSFELATVQFGTVNATRTGQ
jgi:hypothetical protein